MWLKKDLPDGRQVQRIFIPKGFDWVKTISPMLSKAGEGPVMWCPAVHKSDLHAIDLLDGVFSTARRGRHGCDVVSNQLIDLRAGAR